MKTVKSTIVKLPNGLDDDGYMIIKSSSDFMDKKAEGMIVNRLLSVNEANDYWYFQWTYTIKTESSNT